MIHSADDARLTEFLRGPVVDSRLELVSVLGGAVLATLNPTAGTITWDTTDRRGNLDVDVTAPPILNARHPIAALGQVLEARWTWPDLGMSIPCGRWLVAEPGERDGERWQVSADPEGPARLARAQWWMPGGTVTTGTLSAQVTAMMNEARIRWSPYGAFGESGGIPATECAPGDPILSTVQTVLDNSNVGLRADRMGQGVILYRQNANGPVDWSWTDTDPMIHKVTGSVETREVPNRVTVWWEKDEDGVRTVGGWSHPQIQGPRRWGGPYGQVPHVVKLDEEATQAACKAQAIRMLADFQERAATVRVEMRADPRIEVGDMARIASPADATDCTARVASVQLDAATGVGTVECAALTGTVAGTPAAYAEL